MTSEQMEKMADDYASEFYNKDSKDIDVITLWYNRHSNYLEGLKKANEMFQNSWSKGCDCGYTFGQTWCCNHCGLPYSKKTDKIENVKDVARKVWKDTFENNTLTYNSFEEYFENEFNKAKNGI
jgi:hypothetical protein